MRNTTNTHFTVQRFPERERQREIHTELLPQKLKKHSVRSERERERDGCGSRRSDIGRVSTISPSARRRCSCELIVTIRRWVSSSEAPPFQNPCGIPSLSLSLSETWLFLVQYSVATFLGFLYLSCSSCFFPFIFSYRCRKIFNV